MAEKRSIKAILIVVWLSGVAVIGTVVTINELTKAFNGEEYDFGKIIQFLAMIVGGVCAYIYFGHKNVKKPAYVDSNGDLVLARLFRPKIISHNDIYGFYAQEYRFGLPEKLIFVDLNGNVLYSGYVDDLEHVIPDLAVCRGSCVLGG